MCQASSAHPQHLLAGEDGVESQEGGGGEHDLGDVAPDAGGAHEVARAVRLQLRGGSTLISIMCFLVTHGTEKGPVNFNSLKEKPLLR